MTKLLVIYNCISSLAPMLSSCKLTHVTRRLWCCTRSVSVMTMSPGCLSLERLMLVTNLAWCNDAGEEGRRKDNGKQFNKMAEEGGEWGQAWWEGKGRGKGNISWRPSQGELLQVNWAWSNAPRPVFTQPVAGAKMATARVTWRR